MACLVDGQSVTYLYKFKEGVCEKSHGVLCASNAGLPAEVVQLAASKAASFELSLISGSVTDQPLLKEFMAAWAS